MKKSTKIVATIFLMAVIVALFATTVLAVDPTTIKADTSSTVATAVSNLSGQILGVVQVVGTAVAVIMLVVLAIKYISAAPNDKAEIKKHAVVYIVGAVILFGAVGLLQIIKGFGQTINNTVSTSSVPAVVEVAELPTVEL